MIEMTKVDFVKQANDVVDTLARSNRKGEDKVLLDWEVVALQSSTYMIHPTVFGSPNLMIDMDVEKQVDDETLQDDTILEDGDAVPPSSMRQSSSQWRFSVVYSDTWKVPVLYFSVQVDSAGNPCSREEVLSMLPCPEVSDTWDFLSHDEHPVTGAPSYFLHPCRTADRLELMLRRHPDKDSVVLLSWFSLVLPAVGYRLPPALFQELHTSLMSL
jgi:ubiquitin-like-conjugating enzyme ATG10